MAKALYGHLSGRDARVLAEVARLRSRVRLLEAENADLRSELVSQSIDRALGVAVAAEPAQSALA